MKALMITAPSSNVGKTTITLGLIRAIKNRGFDIAPFKTGPDLIDSKYHSLAAARPAGNLDMHMMGREGLKDALYLNKGDLILVEGAMGYFDGIYNGFENSSYDISRSLDIPSVMIYSPKGEMFSIIPKLQGMVNFPDSKIKGLILNKTSQPIYKMLKDKIEAYVDIKVLGYLDKNEDFTLEESGQGLEILRSQEDLFIEKLARSLEETVDIDGLLELMGLVDISKGPEFKFTGLKIGIARDRAFSLCYNENIEILKALGHVEYFSPLNDLTLPKVDFIYLGPGTFKEEDLVALENNTGMREALTKYIDSGGHVLAEREGLMYLSQSIESYDMVGIFKSRSVKTKRLERFGYVYMEMKEDTILGKRGSVLRANEYHRSKFLDPSGEVLGISKPQNPKNWTCGYRYKNVLGYFQNINFLGNKEAILYLFEDIMKKKRG